MMIPVCEPVMSGKLKEYVNDCLETGWISSNGKYIKLFENSFASFTDSNHCVCCSSGTAALHLALASLKIGLGDEVVIPAFTMCATWNSVLYTGAVPVPVDSEPGTWNIDVNKIQVAITSRTKAIIVVHTYGHPVDMDAVLNIAGEHGIPVIEDAAEAHGAEYKGRKIGSIGLLSTFSFYGNKIITTGEGGAVTTDNAELAERIESLKNHCLTTPRFVHHEVGFNYRMTNIQAAIGLAQLEQAGELIENKRKNAHLYNSFLSSLPDIELPVEAPWAKNVYWMYGIVLKDSFSFDRDRTMSELRDRGIDSRAFFLPMHLQPVFKKMKLAGYPLEKGSFPVSERLGSNGLYLPSSGNLNKEQIETVCDAIKDISGSAE